MVDIQRSPTQNCDVGATEETLYINNGAGLSFERTGYTDSSRRVGIVGEQVSTQK